MLNAFDLLNADLNGTQLIEASAGTGKTYTIAGIYLRLVIEEALTVEQILVVTFTRAATEELKERIYAKLVQARQAFEFGFSPDPLVNQLVQVDSLRPQALGRLEAALADFDRAAIFTIHGFCQRLLTEFAFETGSLYELELIADPTVMLNEVAEDFWRQHLYAAPAELIGFLQKQHHIGGPDYFLKLAQRVNRPDIHIVPDAVSTDLKHLNAYRRQFERTRRLWSNSKIEILQLLNAAGLNGRIYGKQNATGSISDRRRVLGRLSERLEAFFSNRINGFPLFRSFDKLCASTIARYTLKKSPTLDHPFFDSCEQLQQTAARLEADMERYLLGLKLEFAHFLTSSLKTRKLQQQVLFYDDLLVAVNTALNNPNNRTDALLRAVQDRYRVALVDEFQDTDPVQYHIFVRLFNTAKSALFMIGDPKQSIYSFRGADIFTYLHAAATTKARSTLEFNWRSEPALLEALNSLFLTCRQPFMYERISFRPVKAALDGPTEPQKGLAEPPLEVWYLPSPGPQPHSKAAAEKRISESVAAEIGSLLNDRADQVEAGQIAVLVRTNRQARIVRQALIDKGIAAVIYRSGDVIDTREAEEMERLLAGIAGLHHEGDFRAAATTAMIGVSGRQLAHADENSEWWTGLQERFMRYHTLWKQHGFIHMFNELLSGENVRARLLGYPDGHRRLTNVLHLAEIIHHQADSQHLGMQSLLKWFSRRRHPDSLRPQINELRLESDERAVKVITIHMSKGLEFPVVFCPFCWEGLGSRPQADVFFHAGENGQQRYLDLGSENLDNNRRLADNEALAESLRLFYVAVTRAKRKCYVVWGRIRSAETSALAYLLHCPRQLQIDNVVSQLKHEMTELTDADLQSALVQLQAGSNGRIHMRQLPLTPAPARIDSDGTGQNLHCRSFQGQIRRSWTLTSYTALVNQPHEGPGFDDLSAISADTGAENAVLSKSTATDSQLSIHQFPRGSQPGIFFHSLLQELDFTATDRSHMQQLVGDGLRRHAYDSKWQPVVCRNLRQLIDTPLVEGAADLKLSRIPKKDRINEMAFTFRLNPFSHRQLQRIIDGSGPAFSGADVQQRLKQIAWLPEHGFMNGFIDLVFRYKDRFYIVDWKSNALGLDAAAYHPERLHQIMLQELYVLQYLIYILALNRYLKQRQPDYRYENDFGGVFYMFLRGIDPAAGPSNGIYFDRPRPEVVEELDRLLISRE